MSWSTDRHREKELGEASMGFEISMTTPPNDSLSPTRIHLPQQGHTYMSLWGPFLFKSLQPLKGARHTWLLCDYSLPTSFWYHYWLAEQEMVAGRYWLDLWDSSLEGEVLPQPRYSKLQQANATWMCTNSEPDIFHADYVKAFL